MLAQIAQDHVNITNSTSEIQKLIEDTANVADEDLCTRLLKFYHCLLNLVNEECLIDRIYVTYFNEIESRLREFKCKLNSGDNNRKFFYYFKTRFYSSEFNDDEDDSLEGILSDSVSSIFVLEPVRSLYYYYNYYYIQTKSKSIS